MKVSGLPEKMLIFVAEASLKTMHLNQSLALLSTTNIHVPICCLQTFASIILRINYINADLTY